MNNYRIITIALLFLLLGGAWLLTQGREDKGPVTTIAAWELWTDVMRDVDHFGLRLTRVSDEEEMAFGDKIAASFGEDFTGDPQAQKYLQEVASALTPYVRRKDIRYKFHLLDMPIINAFAIPGGHIYVTRMMLDFLRTEAELAALLGHEISHVDLRHCIERFQYQLQLKKLAPEQIVDLAQFAYQTLTVGYSKQQEREADIRAVTLMAQAQYHPKHALSMDDRMADIDAATDGEREPRRFMIEELNTAVLAGVSDYLASHPQWKDRMREQTRTLAKNEADWSGKSFYAGRSNHADRVSRQSHDRAVEHLAYEEPPGFRPYLSKVESGAFAAFAAHLPSGLSASADSESSPMHALETSIAECEKKMKPCVLYALDSSLTVNKDARQIEGEAAAYLKSVCTKNPPDRALVACRDAGFAPGMPDAVNGIGGAADHDSAR